MGNVEGDIGQLVKQMRKWAVIHRGVIDLAVSHALQVEAFPDRIFTHYLMLTLKHHPSAKPASRFSVFSAAILPLPPLELRPPYVRAQVADIVDKGGLGIAYCSLVCGAAQVPHGAAVMGRFETRVLLRNWLDILKDVTEGRVKVDDVRQLTWIKPRITDKFLDKEEKYGAINWSRSGISGEILSKADPNFREPLPDSFCKSTQRIVQLIESGAIPPCPT